MTTGGTPPPLSVDPAQLSAAGGALLNSALDLPNAPAPFMPVGTDPLSVAIIGQIPAVETPVMTQLPLVQTQSAATARNVVGAAEDYSATDQQNGAAINEMMQNRPGEPVGTGGGGPASAVGGGADSMSQMMSTPMQMASQMGQMPMQVMSAVAAVPQGIMQGAQQAGQQIQQMVGQFGQGGAGGQGGSNGPGVSADSSGPQPTIGEVHLPSEEPAADEKREEEDGAAAGQPGAERAPDPTNKADENGSQTAPGRHRAAEPDDRINL